MKLLESWLIREKYRAGVAFFLDIKIEDDMVLLEVLPLITGV
jgi:hypothetical protein